MFTSASTRSPAIRVRATDSWPASSIRDDHVWFRHLTRSAGLIEPVAGAGPGPIRFHLIGTADYPKPVRKVAGRILAEFNAAKPQWPDGSRREFELLLGSKDAIQLATSKP